MTPREPADFRIDGSTLVVLNKKGGELWRFETGTEDLIGEKSYRGHYQFKKESVNGLDLPWLIIRDITGDGRKEVLVNSNARGFFPTQLAVLGSDGKLRGEYWNSGQLLDVVGIDLDHDGRKEIVVSGQNNEYRKPCLVVFDADRVSGCSPQSVDKFVSPGIPAGTQRAYELFPRTDVSLSESPAETAGRIEVLSNDLILVTMNSCRITFELDLGLVLRLVRTSHPFEQLHKIALREGRVASVLDDAYFDALRRGVLYWDGAGWSAKGSGLNF